MKLRWMTEGEPLRVRWPVTFTPPVDGGGVACEVVEVQFEILPAAEFNRLLAGESREGMVKLILAGEDPDAAVAIIRRVVTGWDEEALGPFGAEALVSLVRYPFARTNILDGYNQAAQGRRAKN
jgi:hypothetical protein